MIKNVENVVYFISQKFTIFIRTLKFCYIFQLMHFTIYVSSTLGVFCVCDTVPAGTNPGQQH